ncbi:hypothetical protein FQN55_009349 [Onygenales sp. PD_40]|nr:hypothetical protein FQN55_009349 [Onygenales sp. PD_40]KAK2798974.1 hypothetical protein FQN51_007202 [Onygenales sp. PD_10]
MDEPGTVFYLSPLDDFAKEIVQDPANRQRRRADPRDRSGHALRIGLEQPSKTPSYLVKFGRASSNDVILGKRWSRNDQCYFDFNPRSGELLLHDISKRANTSLYQEADHPQIWKIPRQCVVLLDQEWTFEIGCARFLLIPRAKKDAAVFSEEKLAFVRQPIPEEYQGTYQGADERLFGLESESYALTTTVNTHNTRVTHPDQPKPGQEIRYAFIQGLGAGAQGSVDEVVDLYDGEHYARKIVKIMPIPQQGIHSESAFRKRIREEVDMVRQLKHDHIVTYTFHQGWQIGQNIELFMDIYEGSLKEKISKFKSPDEAKHTTGRMFYQMLLALDYIHTRNPPILHRDVKPQNILYRGENFYLTDFGIAKVIDASRTRIGTQSYMAPEILSGGPQTPKVDIYALVVTIDECLMPQVQNWSPSPAIRLMAHHTADRRPSAYELLQACFPVSPHPPVGGLQNDVGPSNSVSSIPNQVNERMGSNHSTILTAMDWTRTGPSEPLQERRSPNPRHGNVAAPNRTPTVARSAVSKRSTRSRRSNNSRAKSRKSRNNLEEKLQSANGPSPNGHHTRSQINPPRRRRGKG